MVIINPMLWVGIGILALIIGFAIKDYRNDD